MGELSDGRMNAWLLQQRNVDNTSCLVRANKQNFGGTLNNEDFITAIEEVVSSAAINDTISNLSSPPGRKPPEALIQQSLWFNALSDSDKNMLKAIVASAVNESVFGFLCVLDGVRAISDTEESNNLSLIHGDTLLNDPALESLHDLYKNV